jgi:hypothetical protein
MRNGIFNVVRPHLAFAAIVALTITAGCRAGGTSYQVKWAKRGEAAVAKADAPARAETKPVPVQKTAPVQQTSASPDDSAVELEIPEDDGKERHSRWRNIFSRNDKGKRIQLPRTDLIEDDEPAPKEASFGEL